MSEFTPLVGQVNEFSPDKSKDKDNKSDKKSKKKDGLLFVPLDLSKNGGKDESRINPSDITAETAWSLISSLKDKEPTDKKEDKHESEVVSTIVPETELSLKAGIKHNLRLDNIEIDNDHEPYKPPQDEDLIKPPVDNLETYVDPESVAINNRSDVWQPKPETGGGGNFEPPKPPSNFEDSISSPEPEPNNVFPEQPLTEHPELQHQLNQEHQVRLDGAVAPSQLLQSEAIPQSTTVIERQDNGAGGLALAISLGTAVYTWMKGRKLNRRIRQNSKKHERRINKLENQFKEQASIYQQKFEHQKATNHNLVGGIESADKYHQHELRQQASHFETEQQKLLQEQERIKRNMLPTQELNGTQTVPVEDVVERALKLPTDHHIEKSAWHNIEVDKKGAAVEKPVFTYGQAYKHEQQQEIRGSNTAIDNNQWSYANQVTNGPTMPQPGFNSQNHQSEAKQYISVKEHKTVITTLSQRPWILIAVIVAIFIAVSILILR